MGGAAILLAGLLLAIWGGGSPGFQLVATILLIAGIGSIALSVIQVRNVAASSRQDVEMWREDLDRRVGAVEDAESALSRDAAKQADLDALSDTSDRARGELGAKLESLSAEVARLADPSRETARIESLSVEFDNLAKADRSRDAWAQDVDASLRGLEERRAAFEERARSGRAADHVRLADLEGGLYELAVSMDAPLISVLSPAQARLLTSRYARSSDYLRAKPLLDGFAVDHPDVLSQLETKRLVAAFKMYKRLGYLGTQALIARSLLERSDSSVPRHRLLASVEEAEFFGDVRAFEPPHLDDDDGVHSATGPVVHVVGKTLPDTQTGYTLRTQYSARALQRRGIESVVLSQAGAPGGSLEHVTEREVGGIRCLTVPGPVRYETTYSEWLRGTITESAKVIRELRPSVLHAHSDFLNALVAVHIGRAFGIPVVYESRGFWEESWLSRTLDAHGLTDEYEDLVRRAGVPEAYAWRQAAEIAMREQSTVNLTLGRTMRDHIVELAAPGTITSDEIPLVPNGIEPGQFPVAVKDEALRADLGLHADDVVIGCVSSIVEYEGIDLLVRAFGELERSSDLRARPRLLIVGDGAQLEPLRTLADDLGIRGAIFTGRVPHEEVQRYYGLIDVFVVPRRPTPVSRLVTPLKPFEALATGRALVVSDVEALREIAEDAGDAVAQFRAGDVDDLGRVLSDLIDSPARRREMGARGSEWVSRERTWDANAGVYAEVYRSLGASVP